jgi:hypothetical protein
MHTSDDPARHAALHLSSQLGTLAAGTTPLSKPTPSPLGPAARAVLPRHLADAVGHLHRKRRQEHADKTLSVNEFLVGE